MHRPPRVLLIDDDDDTLKGYRELLVASGFQVVVARSGHEGLNLSRQCDVDVVLADLRLPDLSGVDILRCLRADDIHVPFVIVTGWGTTRSAMEAGQLGASDYVEKPLIGDDLVRVVERALSNATPVARQDLTDLEAHAAVRWAGRIASVIDSPEDPKTFKGWGRCAAASPSALKNWCRTAGVSPRRSLVLARLLRAVVKRQFGSYRLTDLLNVADTRTLERLLRTAGFTIDGPNELPPTVDEFLQRQDLVRDQVLRAALRRALHSRN